MEESKDQMTNLALEEAKTLLERYKSRGLIVRYSGPEREGPIYVFTAYTLSPKATEERYEDLAVEFVRISRKYRVTVLLDVEECSGGEG